MICITTHTEKAVMDIGERQLRSLFNSNPDIFQPTDIFMKGLRLSIQLHRLVIETEGTQIDEDIPVVRGCVMKDKSTESNGRSISWSFSPLSITLPSSEE